MLFNEFYKSRIYGLYNLRETCQDRYRSIISCFIFCSSFMNRHNSHDFAAVRKNSLGKTGAIRCIGKSVRLAAGRLRFYSRSGHTINIVKVVFAASRQALVTTGSAKG